MLVHGEEIALRCDHILFREDKFNAYPRLVKEGLEKFINLSIPNKSPIQNGTYVFVSTDDLWKKDTFVGLSRLQNKFTLVCGTSDHPFIDVLLPLFDRLPNLTHIYTTNCHVSDPRVTPVPLGFNNSLWWNTPNDLDYIETHKNKVVEKDLDVYFYFSVATNPVDRQPCRDILERKGFVWDVSRSFEEYVPYLARHRFCICPVGNGYDTHRFWEALAVRCIPVCLHNPIVDFYAQFLPIVVLNSWEELTREMLEGIQGVEWGNLDTLLDVENWNMFGPNDATSIL
jgi:hypothetical protein